MTAKIIHLLNTHFVSPPNRGPFLDPAPFTSVCPTCNEPRLQMGYSPSGLLRRINGARPIEACCVTCNQFWPINAQERLRLSRELEHLRLS